MAVINRRANLDRLMSGNSDNSVATCESCGSTYFFDVQVSQYNKGYGSVEYTPTSFTPKSIKVCPCGTTLPIKGMGKTASSEIRVKQEELTRSLAAANEYREKNSAQALVNSAVSPKELEEAKSALLMKIEELSVTITSLKASKVVTKEK